MEYLSKTQLADTLLPFLSSADDRLILSAKMEQPDNNIPLPETILSTVVVFKVECFKLFQAKSSSTLSVPKGVMTFETAMEYVKRFVRNTCPFVTDNTHLRTATPEFMRLIHTRIFSNEDVPWITARVVNPSDSAAFSSEIFYKRFPTSGQHFGLQAMRERQQTFWSSSDGQNTARVQYVKKIIELADSGAYQSRYRVPRLEKKFENCNGSEKANIYTYEHYGHGTAIEKKREIVVRKYISERNIDVSPGNTHMASEPWCGTGHPARSVPYLNVNTPPIAVVPPRTNESNNAARVED